MLVATCPSREELLDYAVGKLSDEAAESLAGHLDSCENCQVELAALSDADDSLVARLRGPLTPDPFLDEPECTHAVTIARAVAENDASATNLPRLLGEYQLSAKLGSGGMGTVYKALHTKLGRVVALKVLTRARTHDPAAVARFEREMQAVGQLDHRHIVRAHDAREIDGTPILVMEYLDGLDLGEIVRRAGVPALAGGLPSPSGRGAGDEGGRTPAPGIPVPDAAELARQTAVGLQTIHEHGLVHRDIKPSNLMLTADGEVKILDLGLARLRPDVPPGEEMTATGQGMGTADYMAPEQASDSRAVDIRADIYSLGCTLYKLLTGRAPFSGRDYCTAFDKMTAHVHAAPTPVRDFAPAVPEGLATVLDRMLAKNPANRFATPAEVADAFAPYCTGADLAALLKRAASSPPLPPGDSRSRLPSGTNSGHPEKNNLPSPSARETGDKRHRWKRFIGQLVLLLLAGGLGFALAITLRIHKNGNDTTVTLPDGSSAQIGDNGQVDVSLPGTTKSAKTNNAPESQIKIFTIIHDDAQKLSNMLTTLFPEQAAGSKPALVPLRISVDTRTNQIIASGTNADLNVVEAIIRKFDDSEAWHSPARPSPTSTAPVPFPKSSASGNAPNPFTTRGQAEATHAAAPLPTVRITQPVVCDVCDYEEYTGRIESAEVPFPLPSHGILAKSYFKEGMSIREGELLAEIVTESDPKVAEALEAEKLANSHRFGNNPGFARVQAELKAAAEELASAVQDAPRVKVVAPISGKLTYVYTPGSANGRGGGLPSSGSPPFLRSIELAVGSGPRGSGRSRRASSLAVIAAPDSMIVNFDVPEQAVLAHRRMPNRKPGWELSLPVVFGLADEKGFPYRGKVVSVAEGISSETQTQRWQAIVPNNAGLFMPGMSIRVRVITSEPHKLMLVPNSISIRETSPFNEGRADAEVVIVNDRNVVESRKVSMGRQYDGFVSIQDGLNANDLVVISDPRSGRGGRWNVGSAVAPEKVTTSPPPWASISVPPSVTVARPVVREVTDYQDFTGHVEAAQTAEIRARASGNLDKVCFKPGMSVKKGDVLFEVAPRLYQAELDQAKGAVKQAQIRLNARKLDFDRMQVLAKNKAVSQEEIDKAKSERDEAEAAVQTAEAALNVAQLRLDCTKITAPFDGNISRSLLDAGNLVTADKTALATLASTDPMYVYFDVDQQSMLTIRRTGNDRALSLPVAFALPDEKGFPHRGKMDSADSRIDTGTGMFRWRAALPNKDGMLSPGMFVRVRLETGGPHKVLVVPTNAVNSEVPPLRDIVRWYVLTVNDQNVVERRDVEPRALADDDRNVAVTGLADDWVIAPGVWQLKPGTMVTPEKSAPAAK